MTVLDSLIFLVERPGLVRVFTSRDLANGRL
jgi:hypothetical protein